MADLLTNLAAAAGAAGGENLYIEDTFSTYLYTGNGSTQTITNGIDLDGEGGLVWIKRRTTGSTPPANANDHILFDTERGQNVISTNTTDGQYDQSANFTPLTTGFSLNTSASSAPNATGASLVSWAFRKAPKFFDVVTYTGTGANRTVAHNLGSVPGCIMVKRTDTTGDWQVYHRANTANPETDYLVLNSTAATADSNTRWNDTQPTDAVFSLGTEATVNASGGTYVAYLFAHDDGGFGDDGEQNVISCGSYTGNGSTSGPSVNLGYEPQWLLIKGAVGAVGANAHWYIFDSMRGIATSGNDAVLRANLSDAEYADNLVDLTSTGFQIKTNADAINISGGTIIYIAIRRGPMKTPTAGTEVFAPIARTGTGADAVVTTGTNADLITSFQRTQDAGGTMYFFDKLRGNSQGIRTGVTNAEAFSNPLFALQGFGNTSYSIGTGGTFNGSALTYVNYSLTRAPGFFDEVCYTGTGSATTFTHNLTVVPELMIVKRRSTLNAWAVYAGDNTDFLVLNTTAATADNNTYWNDTSPTSTVFSVGTNDATNASASTYVAYLFASLAGVSDIGTYTGNGTSVSVTTGFQPRFILVKRTDSTGNWIVGDSARGLVAGNDPFLELNTSDAEVTNEDWVDVSATGFTINETAANANVSTATYLYLAIS
jgi:hypothetical protein